MDAVLGLSAAPGAAASMAIALALCCGVARGASLRRRAAAALLAMVATSPGLDLLARHALWLHALQGVVLHHLIGRVLFAQVIAAAPAPAHRARRGTPSGGAIVFALATVAGMLPRVHGELMRDAAVYASMNWAMLLSGLWWCHGRRHDAQAGCGAGLAVLPSVIVGIALLFAPPLYVLEMALCRTSDAPGIAAMQRVLEAALSPRADQRLAGVLILLGGLAQMRSNAWRSWRSEVWKLLERVRLSVALSSALPPPPHALPRSRCTTGFRRSASDRDGHACAPELQGARRVRTGRQPAAVAAAVLATERRRV